MIGRRHPMANRPKGPEKKHVGGWGQFAAKLTFEERCGYYYASLLGVPRSAIVKATGLNRGTVLKLTSRKYKDYGEIHLKFDELKGEEFCNRYYTTLIKNKCTVAVAALAQSGDVHCAAWAVHHGHGAALGAPTASHAQPTCRYPDCDCAVSFPQGYKPSIATECPKAVEK